MFDLFKNEYKRYQKPALVMMIVQLAIWGFIYTQKPILANHQLQSGLMNLFMILSGLLFGVLQMALHRRKNNWAYLLHRPISPAKIHLALISAAAVLMLIAVVLPFLMVLMILDLFTSDPVELRHYLYLLHMIGLTFSCYLIGTYTVLSPNKGALLTFGLVFLMVNGSHSSALLTLMTDLVITVITFYLSKKSFKINLSSHFKQKTTIFIAALVLQPALAFVIFLSQSIYYHLPMMLLDKHPDQYTQQQNLGYYSVLWHMENHQRVKMILEGSDYPDVAQLIEQVKLASSDAINGRLTLAAVRGELFYKDRSYALDDEANNKQWIFSHNKMLFEGRDSNSGDLVGFLGKSGFFNADISPTDEDRFEVIPKLTSNQYVQSSNTLYGLDFDQQLMEVKHQLPEGETYQSAVLFNRDTAVIILFSDKALYFFDPDEFSEENIYTKATNRVVHPITLGNDTQIHYSKLIDGYLVEYRRSQVFGYEKPLVKLIYAKHNGQNNLIGEMSFIDYRPLPKLVTDSNFWISPIIDSYVFSFIQGLYNPKDGRYVTLDNIGEQGYGKETYLIAILLAMLSAITTFFIASRLPMNKSTRVFWVLLNLIFSIPGLLCFLLMNPWRDYLFYRYQKPLPS